MNSSPNERVPTSEEREAMEVLKAVIGAHNARVAWRKETPSGKNYDADLFLPIDSKARVEITSSDGGVRNLASTYNRLYAKPSTQFVWTIEIKPLSVHGSDMPNSQQIKQIVGEINPILRKIEREYMVGVDSRLFDPRFYNTLLQNHIRPKRYLRIKITAAKPPNDEISPGVTVKVLPSASLQIDNTDILTRRTQDVIDDKSNKDQGASCLVVLLCDYGGGAEQLRELCKTSEEPPNGASAIDDIDLGHFSKVLVYTKDGEEFACLELNADTPWRFGLWATQH